MRPLLIFLAVTCLLPGWASAGAGPSFLETPTYTLAAFLVFFLAISVIFEKLVHWTLHALQHHGRKGLATAVNNFVTELTLIGFVSLILIVCEDKLHSICVPYSGGSYEAWILLDNVNDCNCCLADTSGVGYCFQKARDCGADFCMCGGVDHCDASYATSDSLRHLLGSGGGAVGGCDGKTALETELATCPEGKFPLISLNALHQVHLFIFVVAVGHVTMGIVMIILSTWQVSIWRRWSEEDDEHAFAVRQTLEAQRSMVMNTSHSTKSLNSMKVHSLSNTRRGHLQVDVEDGTDADDAKSESAPSKNKMRMDSLKAWAKEWGTCLLLQFHPMPVSREQFAIMRASFMLTHHVPESFNFMDYITTSLDDDFAQIVGVNIELWATMIIFILISGVIGWPVLIFLVLAAVTQMILDAKLVKISRHVCKDHSAKGLVSNIFWFKKPPLLLIPIKFSLFLCSFIISTIIFFAAVFGPNSCPLGNNGFWFAWSAPWWTSIIFTMYIFLHLSFKTLPLYSLAVQMGSDFKSHMLPKGMREKLLRIAASAKQRAKSKKESEEGVSGKEEGGH